MKVHTNERGQAIPEGVVHIGPEAFDQINHTEIRWLSGGGAMINSRGTIIMLDPVLEGFDMPLIYNPPIVPAEVIKIDGYCVTHIDTLKPYFSRNRSTPSASNSSCVFF